MDECAGQCVQERDGEGRYSSPTVRDDELVCRTVRPEDFTKKGVLKPSFIQTSRLRAGELSAWRLSDAQELSALNEKLTAAGRAPDNIIAASAAAIRGIQLDGLGRAVSVVNDTRIDEADNHDPMHIALAPCMRLMARQEEVDELIADLKTRLMTLFRSSGIALKPPQAANGG